MKKTILISFIAYSAYSFAQNDECAGAISLTPGTSCSTTSGNTSSGFSDSGVGCATGTEDDDVWYKFVATASTHTVTVDGASDFDAVLAAYTSCAAANSPAGGSCTDNTAGDGVEVLNLSALTAGTTYYLKVHDYDIGGGSFTICVQSPPPEDECSGAITLTAGIACSPTAGNTTSGFSNSGVGCTNGTEDDDVWYKFVATSTKHNVTVDGSSDFDAVVGAYTSCAATNSPTGGSCTDNTLSDGIEVLVLTSLTVGTTYYVKVHDYAAGGGSFTICIQTPPVNDECGQNATPITLGSTTVGNTSGADLDYTWSGAPCSPTQEVWYQFTTPASVGCYSFWYDQLTNGCNALSIWEGACPSGSYTDYQVNFSTNNYNDQGSNETELAGMLPNTTYYISVSNSINTNFNFNIRPNTPLATNDQCTSAQGIGTNPQQADNAVAGCEYSFVSGQDGGLQSTDPNACNTPGEFPCTSGTGYGPAAICALTLENISWYNFTAQSSGSVTITFAGIECNNGGGGFQSGLFTGSNCTNLTATGVCIAAASGTATYTINNAVAGASYYIAMDGNAGSNCHYQVSGINVTPLPVEMGEFHASESGPNQVRLDWFTYSERNNNYFTLERTQDGVHFTTIAVVTGHGSTSGISEYSVTDENPLSETSYYRLSQTDFDGVETESSFASITRHVSEEFNLEIYPNPSEENNKTFVKIRGDESVKLKIEIYDLSGKLVNQQEFNTLLSSKLELKHHFEPGVYFIKASNSKGETASGKLLVK